MDAISPVKQLREDLHLSQSAFAAMATVSQSHLSEVERGMIGIGEHLREFLDRLDSNTDKIIQRNTEFMKLVREDLEREVAEAMSRAK